MRINFSQNLLSSRLFFFKDSTIKANTEVRFYNIFEYDSNLQLYIINRQMSIYSGFATRNQQQFYDKIIYNLISTLLLRLSKFYKRQSVDDGAFMKIVFEQEKSLRKMEKRKYLEPKFAELLTIFKRQITQEEENEQIDMRQMKEHRSRAKQNHELNRTLSVLGKEFGQLRANYDKVDKIEKQDLEDDNNPSLAKIAQRKKHVSKGKKKQKKTSIKSNLDIWDVRQQKPPELPSLHPGNTMHPLHVMHRTIMSKTKFNSKQIFISDFSQKMNSKQIQDLPNDEQAQSLRNILAKPPKFRAKIYFK